MKSSMVLVPEQREENEVDRLQRRVEEIQSQCDHEFRLTEEPVLFESFVDGVYVGTTAGPTRVPGAENRTIVAFELVCLRCSKSVQRHIKLTCPVCLSDMKESSMVEGLEPPGFDRIKATRRSGRDFLAESEMFQRCGRAFSREYYFGRAHLYYSILRHRCSKCGFTTASDYWNQ